MWGWISNFSTMHLLFHHQMIRCANNRNICPLCLCIFILVFIYWTKPPPHLKGAAGMECQPRVLSLFIWYYLCLHVNHNISPLSSWASISPHETWRAFISSMMNHQKGEVQTLLLNQAPRQWSLWSGSWPGIVESSPLPMNRVARLFPVFG